MSQNCQHEGPHQLDWNGFMGRSDTHLSQHIETALNHVEGDDVEPGDLDTMYALLDRAAQLAAERNLGANRPLEAEAYMVEISDAELEVARRVLHEACQYMYVNDYASDEDFPEDAAAARTLGASGGMALACWADTLFRNAQREGGK